MPLKRKDNGYGDQAELDPIRARFAEAKAKSGKSWRELSEFCGHSNQYFSRWLNGGAPDTLPDETVAAFAAATKSSFVWLRTGHYPASTFVSARTVGGETVGAQSATLADEASASSLLLGRDDLPLYKGISAGGLRVAGRAVETVVPAGETTGQGSMRREPIRVQVPDDRLWPLYNKGDILFVNYDGPCKEGRGVVVENQQGQFLIGILREDDGKSALIVSTNPGAEEHIEAYRSIGRECGVMRG